MRIAAAVEALMVMAHDVERDFGEAPGLGQALVAVFGMAPHQGRLGGGQGLGFGQDLAGQKHLADIVQQSPQADLAQFPALEAEMEAEREGEHAHIDRVHGGGRVAVLEVGQPERGGRVAAHRIRQLGHHGAASGGIGARAVGDLGEHGVEIAPRLIPALVSGLDQAGELRRIGLAGVAEGRGRVGAGARRGGRGRARAGADVRQGAGTRAIGIDVDVLAIRLQEFDLLLRGDLETLEQGRQFGPGAIGLGHVQAEAQLIDGHPPPWLGLAHRCSLRAANGVSLGPVTTSCGHRVAALDAGPARREAGV